MPEILIGNVSDFFSHPVVAGIGLIGTLKTGDRVKIKGHTTDLEFNADSIQIDGKAVSEAQAGDSVGIKVPERVRKGDAVYKVIQ
jgi:translation elongation factor EF-Tu-like GTPase